jgi:hypothetical protein
LDGGSVCNVYPSSVEIVLSRVRLMFTAPVTAEPVILNDVLSNIIRKKAKYNHNYLYITKRLNYE